MAFTLIQSVQGLAVKPQQAAAPEVVPPFGAVILRRQHGDRHFLLQAQEAAASPMATRTPQKETPSHLPFSLPCSRFEVPLTRGTSLSELMARARTLRPGKRVRASRFPAHAVFWL